MGARPERATEHRDSQSVADRTDQAALSRSENLFHHDRAAP